MTFSGTFGSLDLEDDLEDEDQSPKKYEDNVKTQQKMQCLKEKMRNYFPPKAKVIHPTKSMCYVMNSLSFYL